MPFILLRGEADVSVEVDVGSAPHTSRIADEVESNAEGVCFFLLSKRSYVTHCVLARY